MSTKPQILIIIGSATAGSSNHQLAGYLAEKLKNIFEFVYSPDLKTLPHFDPEQSLNQPPALITELRKQIAAADGILICTPEYVFSIPSGLKNMIEWCVATTVFSEKPAALITASAHGVKAHEELKLIMQTMMADFTDETCLLVQGINGKIKEGTIADSELIRSMDLLAAAFSRKVNETVTKLR